MECRLDRSDLPAIAGGYAGWTTPYSYNSVRTLQQDIGLLKNGSCLRSDSIEDLITCAAGEIKLPLDQLRLQCARLGLPCPAVRLDSHTCLTCLLHLEMVSDSTNVSGYDLGLQIVTLSASRFCWLETPESLFKVCDGIVLVVVGVEHTQNFAYGTCRGMAVSAALAFRSRPQLQPLHSAVSESAALQSS